MYAIRSYYGTHQWYDGTPHPWEFIFVNDSELIADLKKSKPHGVTPLSTAPLVITSYSIHYTKLYDLLFPPPPDRFLPGPFQGSRDCPHRADPGTEDLAGEKRGDDCRDQDREARRMHFVVTPGEQEVRNNFV